MTEKGFLEKIKARWGITSNFQVLIIFIVFGITGSLSVKIAGPILNFIGITDDLNPWIYWPLRILAILPVYQVILLICGTVFGQFQFFWNFEKRTFGRLFGIKK